MPILSAVGHPNDYFSSFVCDCCYPNIGSPDPTSVDTARSSYGIYYSQSLDLERRVRKTQKKKKDKTMAVSCAQARSLGSSKSGGNGATSRQQGNICNERWVVLNKDTFQEIFEKSIDELICLNEPQSNGDVILARDGGKGCKIEGDNKISGSSGTRSVTNPGNSDETDEVINCRIGKEKERERKEAGDSFLSSSTANNSQRTESPARKNNSKSNVQRKTRRHSRKNRDSPNAGITSATADTSQPTRAPGDSKGESYTSNEIVVGSTGISPVPKLSITNTTTTTSLGSSRTCPEDNNQDGCVNKVVCESSCCSAPVRLATPNLPPPLITQSENASLRKDRPMVCRAGSSAHPSGRKASELENSGNKNPKRPLKGESKKREGEGGTYRPSTTVSSYYNNNNNNYNPTSGCAGKKTLTEDVTTSVKEKSSLGFIVDDSVNAQKTDIDNSDRDQLIDSTASVTTDGTDQPSGVEERIRNRDIISCGVDVVKENLSGVVGVELTDSRKLSLDKNWSTGAVNSSGGVRDIKQKKNKGIKKNSCGKEERSGYNNESVTNQELSTVSTRNNNNNSSSRNVHQNNTTTVNGQDLSKPRRATTLDVVQEEGEISHERTPSQLKPGESLLSTVEAFIGVPTRDRAKLLEEGTQFQTYLTCITESEGLVDSKEKRIICSRVPGDPNQGPEKDKGELLLDRRGEDLRTTQVLLSERGDQASGVQQHNRACLQASERRVDVVETQQDLAVGPSFVGVSSSQGPVSKDQSEVLSLKSHASIYASGSSEGNDGGVSRDDSQFSKGSSLSDECVVSHGKRVNNINNNDYGEEELRNNTSSDRAMSDLNMRVISGSNKMNTKSLSGSKRRLVKHDNINWISVNKADMMNLVNEIVFEGYADNSLGNEQGHSDDNTEGRRYVYSQDKTPHHSLHASDGQQMQEGELQVNDRPCSRTDNPISSLGDQYRVTHPGHTDELAKSSSQEDGPIDLSQANDKSQHLPTQQLNPHSLSKEGAEPKIIDPRILHHQAFLFREGALKMKHQDTVKDHTNQSHKSSAKIHSKSGHNQVNSKQSSKQCWVALNKDMVMDIVDTAYDSIDRQLQHEYPKSPFKNHMDNNEYVFVNEDSDITLNKYMCENRSRNVHSQSDKDSDIDVETVDSDLNPDENVYPNYSSTSTQIYKDAFYGKQKDDSEHSEEQVCPSSKITTTEFEHRKKSKHCNEHPTGSRKRKRNEVTREQSVSPSHQLIRGFEDLSSSSPKRSCSPTESEVLCHSPASLERGHGYNTPPPTSFSENEVVAMAPVDEGTSLGNLGRSLQNESMLYSLMLDKVRKTSVPSNDQSRRIGGDQSDMFHKADLSATSNKSNQQSRDVIGKLHSIASAPNNRCGHDSVSLGSPSKATEVDQSRYSVENGVIRERQSSPNSTAGGQTDTKTPRDSPKLGWVAVSKEDVHTIVASVMNEMISTEVGSPKDNNSCSSFVSHKTDGSPRRSVMGTEPTLQTYPSPSRQDREGHTPSPSSLSSHSGPQEDANLPEDDTHSIEGSAHTPNSTSSSRGFKWKTSLLKRAREEDEDQLSSDSVSDQSPDDMSHDQDSHDQLTSHRRSRRSKRKT